MTRKIYSVIVLVFSIFLIAPLFLINTSVKAADIRMEDQDQVVIDQLVDDDLYVSAGTIEINDDVKGDLIAFGGQVTINDDIDGNAIIFGGVIKINGDVRGSLYCAGGQVEIEGKVGEDINIGGGMVTVKGNVSDDVRIGAGTVYVKSEEIGGDLLISAGSGNVSKDTTVKGTQYLEIGDTEEGGFQFPGRNLLRLGQRGLINLVITLLRNIGVLIGWLIVGWLLFKFAPVKSREVTDLLTDKKTSVKSLAMGLLFLFSLFIIIPVLTLLAIIGIGQPAFLITLSLLGLIFSIAGIYSSTGIARMIWKAKNSKYDKYVMPMLIGVTVYQVLGWIPCCIGLMVKIIITLWGVGGLILLKWKMLTEAKSKSKTKS